MRKTPGIAGATAALLLGCAPVDSDTIVIDRAAYHDKLEGFWLGQSIGNWTGLVTEMDKIGGIGPQGRFYTREDWGGPDQPAIWSPGEPSSLSPTIDFVLRGPDEVWGADDDTDIEYMYQYTLFQSGEAVLTPKMIRNAWLTHIYDEAEPTPFGEADGKNENYLWVSNQAAHDLMLRGFLPPSTSDRALNPHTDMIDAQLTTEIFGLFAPARPDVAREIASLPIAVAARDEAAQIAQFYVALHSLASRPAPDVPLKDQLFAMAATARAGLTDGDYPAAMYDFVRGHYERGTPWEAVRDALYVRYQVRGDDGYDISSRGLYCNGCFAAGINFGASLISLFYGEGDFKQTIQIATLCGWDADNPAATWGGLLGFMLGADAVAAQFDQPLSNRFHIHRTRRGFPNDGYDDFETMATTGLAITDRVVTEVMGGEIDPTTNRWLIPKLGE